MKDINFHNCHFSNKFLEIGNSLANVNSLESIDLSKNSLNDEISNVLENIISQCYHLKSINLSNNCVGYKCIKSIINAVKNNTSLNILNMSNTDVNAGDLIYFSMLFQICGHLKHLNISNNNILDVNLITINKLSLKPDNLIFENKRFNSL